MTEQICALNTPNSSLKFRVANGYLSNAYLSQGLFKIVDGIYDWQNANDEVHFDREDQVKEYIFAPKFDSFVGYAVSGTNIYVESRDEFDRRFVRAINCC